MLPPQLQPSLLQPSLRALGTHRYHHHQQQQPHLPHRGPAVSFRISCFHVTSNVHTAVWLAELLQAEKQK